MHRLIVLGFLFSGILLIVFLALPRTEVGPLAPARQGIVEEPKLAIASSLVVEEPKAGDCAGECQPVPQGLKGLRFGMTLKEVQAILPDVAQSKDFESKMLYTQTFEPDITPGETVGIPTPPHKRVKTTLGDFPCECRLFFAVEDRLSQIDCQFQGLSLGDAREAATEGLIGELQARYGKADERIQEDFRSSRGIVYRHRWTWQDQGAKLVLTSRSDDFSLVNTSPEHLALLDRLNEELDRLKRAQEEELRLKAERDERELQKLKEAGKSLGRDL